MKKSRRFNVYSLKFLLWACLLILGVCTLSYSFILALVITGLAIAHGVELQHQAIHNAGFKTKVGNKIAGLALGAPMFVSNKEYQLNHLHHHRHLGTPSDQEQFDYSAVSFRSFIASVLLVRNLKRFVLDALRISEPPEVATASHRAEIRFEKRIVAILHLLVVGLLASIYEATGVLYYLGSIVLASVCHYLIELPEHLGCNRDSRCVFDNTRSITSNALMTWFVNGNNLHVEHHYRSGLTPEQCRVLHRELRSKCNHIEDGYVRFYSKLLKRLAQKFFLPEEQPLNGG